jgi:hypothetical protein
MACPAKVRALVMFRTPNPGDLFARMTVRLLGHPWGRHSAGDGEIHGVRNCERAAVALCPFFENATRFNHELVAFVLAATAR